MVRGMSDVHAYVTSVENVAQLAENATREQDAPASAENSIPPNWPSGGVVDFNNVVMSYEPNLPHVLKGVSFETFPGEKVGVVGRTGAGKSSLIMAMFRLSPLSEGCIRIDSIDVSKLPLSMRSSIAIIPQEPVMFRGTLRSNLDPFREHEDQDLITALQQCLLGYLVEAPGGLDQEVSHMGSNFSIGTQQLICLVRALLNKSKLLLLDEATAALDTQTDSQVQSVLRSSFAERTIITIAHRLGTIIDNDRILVMDAGRVAEFDTPYNLLTTPGTIFNQLCLQSDDRQKLLASATRAHQRKIENDQERLRKKWTF
jgi:ATP-binding cassette subfamily C (CFTR/MRP) protein 1